jgi:hypothetical protein
MVGMDLRKYYLENVEQQEYYHNFYELINHVNETHNIFVGYEETHDYKFLIDSVDDAIEKFKYLCQPENESHDNEDSCWFYLILFYLKKCGYVIEEFPRVIEHPPLISFDFVNKEIRNKLISEGKDDNGTVRYAERRKLVANLTFTKRDNYIELVDAIEAKFKEISNRQASFQNMSTDEKLAEIANLIENMLKKDGKFQSLDYTKICFDYIDGDMIKRYRKQIQCFRHSAPESIHERETFSKEQKVFLIDLGLTILKAIHALLNNE